MPSLREHIQAINEARACLRRDPAYLSHLASIQAINEARACLREPDFGDCSRRLDEITGAAGLGTIGDAILGEVYIRGGEVFALKIDTFRGRERGQWFVFPERILDADDPVEAARLWGLERKVEEASHGRDHALDILRKREAALAQAQAELADHLNGSAVRVAP